MRADVLAQRVARAHGWLRTGGSIRSHVERHLKSVEATEEEGGRYLWRDGQRAEAIRYRHPASEDDRRPVGEIPLVELAAFVAEHEEIIASDDPALAFARLIGLGRLAAGSRSRLDAAIALASSDTPRTSL